MHQNHDQKEGEEEHLAWPRTMMMLLLEEEVELAVDSIGDAAALLSAAQRNFMAVV